MVVVAVVWVVVVVVVVLLVNVYVSLEVAMVATSNHWSPN